MLKCLNLYYVNCLFYRYTLLKGLMQYSTHLMCVKAGPKYITELFNLLAIYHLLKEKVKPFGERETNPRNFKWTMDYTDTYQFKIYILRDIFRKAPSPR